MQITLLLHIAAGGLGLLSGFIALYAAKGGALHRKSGKVFVYTMLVMCAAGVVVAAGRGAEPEINIPAALLTAYLVTTSLLTVRPPLPGGRWLDAGAMLVALAVGLTSLAFGFGAIAAGGAESGMAFPLFLFGLVGVLSGVSDFRMIRKGRPQGARRLARHLWRMCFALYVAAGSFFLGQADEFPEALRIPPLLALPVLTVLATMFYWLRRVLRRTSRRDGARAEASEPLGEAL